MNNELQHIRNNPTLVVYGCSTFFMVFFSVNAIQNWPNILAQCAILLACIIPILLISVRKNFVLNDRKNWDLKIKLIFIIIILGVLNVCFSENRATSFKGMGLFLMSGVSIFGVTFVLLRSRDSQRIFFLLCAFCFFCLIFFGVFEFVYQIRNPGMRILLFSSNPIPAGSLLILLSFGPLALLSQSETFWGKWSLITCLTLGALIIALIGQRGPALATLLMVILWAMRKKKGVLVFSIIAAILIGLGYQSRNKIPLNYKNQLLKAETVLVRLEYFRIASKVIKDKPLFGVGFNGPLSRYIPSDYQSKFYPVDSALSFSSIVTGVQTFDNMLLCFLGEMGGLFTLIYFLFFFHLFKVYFYRRPYGTINSIPIILLIVLFGFLTHSMTFDSLKYPHLNWLFHSYLGLFANFNVWEQKV